MCCGRAGACEGFRECILWAKPRISTLKRRSRIFVTVPRVDAQVLDFFTRLVQRVAPKHYFQAAQEVIVTRRFFENFSGDNVRARSETYTSPWLVWAAASIAPVGQGGTASNAILTIVLTSAKGC